MWEEGRVIREDDHAGVRPDDYTSRQRRGRAGNWKPRYPVNRERRCIFRVIREPVATTFETGAAIPTAFARGMACDICTADAHTAYWLLLNVVSRDSRFDGCALLCPLSSRFSRGTAHSPRRPRPNVALLCSQSDMSSVILRLGLAGATECSFFPYFSKI